MSAHPEEAVMEVAQTVPEKHAHIERNLIDREGEGMEPGQVEDFS
jgi:hypothetical protein